MLTAGSGRGGTAPPRSMAAIASTRAAASGGAELATGRSLNQTTKGLMGHAWLVGATGHVYLFVVTPRLAGGAAMLPLVHELRVLLAADEGTAGRRAMVGATRRDLRLDVHSWGESAFQLGTDARALRMARPPAMVAQLGRAAGTVYDTRPDSERLATLCTAIGDTTPRRSFLLDLQTLISLTYVSKASRTALQSIFKDRWVEALKNIIGYN